jgi:hypothetical protein
MKIDQISRFIQNVWYVILISSIRSTDNPFSLANFTEFSSTFLIRISLTTRVERFSHAIRCLSIWRGCLVSTNNSFRCRCDTSVCCVQLANHRICQRVWFSLRFSDLRTAMFISPSPRTRSNWSMRLQMTTLCGLKCHNHHRLWFTSI